MPKISKRSKFLVKNMCNVTGQMYKKTWSAVIMSIAYLDDGSGLYSGRPVSEYVDQFPLLSNGPYRIIELTISPETIIALLPTPYFSRHTTDTILDSTCCYVSADTPEYGVSKQFSEENFGPPYRSVQLAGAYKKATF
jgi:hypothetical protein